MDQPRVRLVHENHLHVFLRAGLLQRLNADDLVFTHGLLLRVLHIWLAIAGVRDPFMASLIAILPLLDTS